ncbi:forkhead box protein N1 isoform X2 [Betta splendens]|uniref:Forkhead box protein N1 isoform X2 n=1 Tax=Betta splendens TaxID=158456 RepID=A0A9W2Y879_BETSP|nr:forkhead box protein N1 isoform X2 [Betta splendens]
MSDSPTFSSGKRGSQTPTPRAGPRTCQPRGASCQPMAEPQTREDTGVRFTQRDVSTFGLRAAGPSRRHSTDEPPGPGAGGSARFHPYRRQFSDGAAMAAACVQQCSPTFSCLQGVCGPDGRPYGAGTEASPPWEQYGSSLHQSSYPELPAVPVEPPCFLPQGYASCSSLGPLQVSSQLYSSNGQTSSSKYPVQGLSTPAHQENTQSLFPKPIYSYSILIFMALKNSKTGSLPVSEIYSFMTEHFPYFKTAPDGWKNSVRHNLSLNKCFEKVENKNGTSSRKGCLWALNPARVEKMQEELHKWRRKDPITVRRSMARPEDLDRLLGERPDKMRPLPPYTNPALISRVAPLYTTASLPCPPPQLRPPVRRPLYAHLPARQPTYLPPAAARPGDSFGRYSPCARQPAAGAGSQGAECGVGPRSMQDLLMEGDSSYDVDTLNPSLTDLQLQGHLWEEIREDTLVSDPLASDPLVSDPLASDPHVPTASPASACLHVRPPDGRAADGSSAGACKAGYEDAGGGQHGCLAGLHPAVYSGVEGLATYLTSCTTSISLM